MSETAASDTDSTAASSTRFEQSGSTAGIFAGVFAMSFSSLLLELALTRLFSVVLFYHFAFLAISIALLGLGAGGVFAYVARPWLERWGTRRLGASVAALNALAVVAALVVVLHVPVELQLTRASFFRLTAIYLASAVPFFFTGLVFSVVFAREKQQVSLLYGADLVGGAAACLALVPLLNFAGGPNAVLFAAAGMALASALWSDLAARRTRGLILTGIVFVVIAANHSGQLIDVVYVKGQPERQNIEFLRWNAISRVDVYDAGAKWASIDADASTVIMNLDPLRWSEAERRWLMSDPPSVVNVLRPRGEYAIIGPGGGVDVLRPVGNGSPSVTGIEINPLIATRIMREKYADYSHHLYQIPQVHIHVSDGRSWVRGTGQRFDVLQMTLVDTWASTAAGAFALSENNLYTVEAFKEYFEHLRPEGMLAITRWEFARPREALRVVSVAMEALRQLGQKDRARHFIVIANGPLLEDGIPVTVLAKKTAFIPEEERIVTAHLASVADEYKAGLVKNPLTALYTPSAPGRNPFSALIASDDPYGFSRGYDFNVEPVTDNAPFFFFTVKPSDILNRGLQKGIDWKVNVGVAVLGMVLLISALAVMAFLVLPLFLGRARAGQSRPLFYFICVGLGYILVEIAFIQRFVLFLGHPTYAITVVVFLMLLASGIGSLLSRRNFFDPGRVRIPLVLVVAALIVYLALLPHLLTGMVGLPFLLKLLLTGILLVPPGIAMGMPFPSGLRLLHASGAETVEWAWALNAASSVLGSVLAMVVALRLGLQTTLACGALAYAAAILLTPSFRQKNA